METLNLKQIRFANFYIETGNATESYIKAGYRVERSTAEVNASRLLRNAKVQEYINARNQILDEEQIADMREAKRFWTAIMRDDSLDIRDRLKASEYIGKTNGAFLEKKELHGKFNKIEFGFVDPLQN